MTDLPFELAWIHGTWRAFWREEKLRIALAGEATAPGEQALATLRDLVGRWPEVKSAIERFAAAFDGHVPLDPPSRGGFDASTCGFDEPLGIAAILVDDAAEPTHAQVLFDTGLPDGYVMYVAHLRSGIPERITAFAS